MLTYHLLAPEAAPFWKWKPAPHSATGVEQASKDFLYTAL